MNERPCARCGIVFRPRGNHLKFCSRACFHTSQRKGHTRATDGYRTVGYGGKQRAEHRIIMEALLGRPLAHTETVHHKNGDRADNRPSNLELWDSAQPPGQRVEDKIDWAILYLQQHGIHLAPADADRPWEIPCGVHS